MPTVYAMDNWKIMTDILNKTLGVKIVKLQYYIGEKRKKLS